MISIIVPMYNVEKYIRRCILSLKSQTYTDIEVLLVDDGSSDNTVKICKESFQDDPRFIIYQKNNEGPGKTREYGVNHANGEYICFVDADDWIDSTFCEKMIYFAGISKADLTRCNVVIHQNGVDEYMWNPPFADTVLDNNFIVNEALPLMIAPRDEKNYKERLPRGCVATLIRRTLISESGVHFTGLRNGEDAVYTMQLMVLAKKMYYVHEYLYHYEKENESSLSSTLVPQVLSQREEKRKIIIEIAKGLPSYNEVLRRCEQEDRRMVYSDARLIVHSHKGNIGKTITNLRELLKRDSSRLAFQGRIRHDLPFQMKVLYFLIKHKMSIMLYLAIRLKNK